MKTAKVHQLYVIKELSIIKLYQYRKNSSCKTYLKVEIKPAIPSNFKVKASKAIYKREAVSKSNSNYLTRKRKNFNGNASKGTQ